MKCVRVLLFITIFGFSLGDELGFKESISNTEINRRRSTQVSKIQAQLIQAQQKQQKESTGTLRQSMENIPVPMTSGAVRKSSDISVSPNVPPFKPIPPAAERPNINSPQPAKMGMVFPPFSAMPSSISRLSVGSNVDPSVAKVMAVVAIPKRKVDKVNNFSDRVLSTANNEVIDTIVAQQPSNSLQAILSANNVTEEALQLALLQRQNMWMRIKSTTTTTTTTTPRPVTSKYANSVGKVMNAPKEYYPVGYDKNFDDNFAARVELPETSFYCGDQKHFPGLYADEDLGCMVFHVCALTDDGLIMKSFLCPESTLFDQTILKCNWWFYVESCKNSKKLYDSNIPISKSYQLMKALAFFSAYKKDGATSTTPNSDDKD